MFKSFFNWLVEEVPVSNWVIIFMLLGLAIVLAAELKRLAEEGRRREK